VRFAHRFLGIEPIVTRWFNYLPISSSTYFVIPYAYRTTHAVARMDTAIKISLPQKRNVTPLYRTRLVTKQSRQVHTLTAVYRIRYVTVKTMDSNILVANKRLSRLIPLAISNTLHTTHSKRNLTVPPTSRGITL